MNGVKIATALLGALPLLAQQSSDCPPPTRTQRIAGLLNRARNPNASANPNCNATAASNSSPTTATAAAGNAPEGAVIGSGTFTGTFLGRPAGAKGYTGYVQLSGNAILYWTYTRSVETAPNVGWRTGKGDTDMSFFGRKGDKYYLSSGTGNGYVVAEVNGNRVTLRSLATLPQGLTNLDGSPREVDPPKVNYSYSFMPYPEQINDALRQQHAHDPEHGLAANQKGGKLVMTPEGGEPVHITVVHTQFDEINFWVNSDDASKAFIIVGTDNATVTPLFRQQDGSWLTEDGKPMPRSGVLH
ncbi:MAG TPA: hypothetical protein VMF91_07455 [Bryobacteraceae bacterium]|nr:hypothetical protein [Bryobacteraceae bacterium]